MKIKSILIALLLLGSMAIPFSAHADITQTDASGYAQASSYIGAELIPGTDSYWYTVTIRAASTYAGQTMGLGIHRCGSGSSATSSPYCGYGSPTIDYATYVAPSSPSYYTLTSTPTDYTFTFNTPFYASSSKIWALSPTRGTYNQDMKVYGSANASSFPNGTCTGFSSLVVSPCTGGTGINDLYFLINTVSSSTPSPPANGISQVTSFSPADGTTTQSTTVTFTYQAYINPNDIGFFLGKQMTFYVQGQPVGLGTYFLDKVQATTSGYFNFSTTTVMSPGNYILNACLEDSELGGLVGGFDNLNPWANPCQYHQFVVGTSTFIGNLFQNGVTAVQGQLNNIAATSSLAVLSNSCNPFSGFDIVQCFYALLIPTSSQMQDTMNSFYSDFLTRVPWGYGSVAVADLLGYGTTATTSLSSSNLTITLPNTGIFATATSTAALKGKTLTFIDWTAMSSTTVHNYWAPALSPLNNFLNIMMGGGFIFWLYHFFKKMKP